MEKPRTLCPACGAKLSYRGARLASRDLTWADLAGADLRDADLSGATLAGAKLMQARLTDAALSGANLSGADLTEADLCGADLSHSNMQGAQLHKVKVVGANLDRASVDLVYASVLRKYKGTPAWATSTTSTAPARYATAGPRTIKCPHCDGDVFEARDLLLNTRGLTLLDLDWLNKSACALVCAGCGRIEWFAKTPIRL